MKRNKNKIELKLTTILIIIVIIATIICIPTFGRYIYRGARNMYLASKNFYFTSNLLGESSTNEIIATYSDWGGIENYILNVRLYSYDNEKQKMTTDLVYNINCEVLDEYKDIVDCAINTIEKDSSNNYIKSAKRDILVSNNNEDSINLYVLPKKELNVDDEIRIKVRAWTDNPYEKELGGIISIKVGGGSVEDYYLVDNEYQPYATLTIRNVNEAERKITILVDASKLRYDMNDEIIKNAEVLDTVKINGATYAKRVRITLKAEAAKSIKLYKTDKKQKYVMPCDEIQISFN